MLALALCSFCNHAARELPSSSLFPTCCMVFKRGKMTGANACGNVGNVLSKQNKHLQRSTSKNLHVAHFCHRFALVEMPQPLLIFHLYIQILYIWFPVASETTYKDISIVFEA